MWQTIGQQPVINLLEKEYRSSKLSHAYLFIGPDHIGKTTLALDFACAINCQNGEPPCGICQSCTKILNNKHSDINLIGLIKTEKNNEIKQRYEISIDEIRNIQRLSSLPPYEGKYKVVIIDNAEYLSEEASNCLLKILEEPQPNMIFTLLTTDEALLLPTIRSRCQKLELKPLSQNLISNYLEDSLQSNKETAELLSKLSRGCIGLAISASKDENYLQLRNKCYSELSPLLDADWTERFKQVSLIENTRKSAMETLGLWSLWWRDILLTKCHCVEDILNIDYKDTIQKWATLLSLPDIKYFINCLQKSRDYITKNTNPKLVFEVLLLDMPKISGAKKDY